MLPKSRVLFMLTFALFFIAGAFATGQDAQDDPILIRMRKDITFLASDECEGRGVGTKGLDLAADYIADQFKKAGLKPGGVDGTYFQPFPFCTNSQLDGDSTLVFTGPKGEKLELKQGDDFQVLGTSAAAKLNGAPVVFVGYGTTARDIEYDDYAGLDVKGKVVIALRRLPRWSDTKKPFDGANKNELAALDAKQIRAQNARAAAIILVNDAIEKNDGLVPFAQMSRGISTISLPFVQMKRPFLEDLLKRAGKNLAAIEKSIDDNLKPQSVALKGWTVNLEAKVKRQETPVKNVLGVLEGKGPLAKETIVVGAHYDHLGYGGIGSRAKDRKKKDIHHGADDNGSGTTAVMELARRFAAIKNRQGRRIVFMTFTAEERGLIGSRHYCRIEPLFALKDTAAMFNLDMVGRVKDDVPDGKKPKLLVLGTESAKNFDDLVKKHNNGFDVVKDKSVFGASDHYSFYTQKIPVLFFWTGTHVDYHRPSDTSDKININGMRRITDYSERIINELCSDPKRPEFVAIKQKFVGGVPNFPKMGILPDYTFGGKGVKVEQVTAGGPAAAAGMKAGDVIVEIAGKAVPDVKGYMAVLATQRPNTALEVKILRDTKEMKLKVTPK